MNQDEARVEQFLRSSGYEDIVHEPDGGVPPDFFVNGRIAIEVRRLNQTYNDGRKVRGLEEVAKGLVAGLGNLLPQLGSSQPGGSWYVTYVFSRPIDLVSARPKVRQVLESFRAFPPQIPPGKAIEVDVVPETLSLRLYRAGNPHPDFFLNGGYTDAQASGWPSEALVENLRHCIAEKTVKIAKVRGWDRYAEWWLMLVNHITPPLNEQEVELIRAQLGVAHRFGKLLVLDRCEPTRAVEI